MVVSPRHDAYAEASARVFDILGSVTPLVEPLSLDEAFLDVTASRALFGAPAEVARRLRARIADEVGLPASAGIAGVKLVAKIASDMAKPNGQVEVPADGGAAFLAPLPVSRLWGVGPKSARALATMGFDDRRRHRRGRIRRRWCAGSGRRARRCGSRRTPSIRARSSPTATRRASAPRTRSTRICRASRRWRRAIHAQALRVARRLRQAGLRARTVQLKLKRADFTLVTRRATLDEPTDDGQLLYREAAALLAREPARPTRLTGVSAQNLVAAAAPQLGLFAPPPRRRRR